MSDQPQTEAERQLARWMAYVRDPSTYQPGDFYADDLPVIRTALAGLVERGYGRADSALRAAARDVVIQEGRYYERDGSGESRFLAVVPKAALAALRAALNSKPPLDSEEPTADAAELAKALVYIGIAPAKSVEKARSVLRFLEAHRVRDRQQGAPDA
jgi:hypothetical protein